MDTYKSRIKSAIAVNRAFYKKEHAIFSYHTNYSLSNNKMNSSFYTHMKHDKKKFVLCLTTLSITTAEVCCSLYFLLKNNNRKAGIFVMD